MNITGALILEFFATLWWNAGLGAAGHGPALLYPLPLIVASALGGAAWYLARLRRAAPDTAADPAQEARRARLVGWASAAEGVAIVVATGLLVKTGHLGALAPVVAIIVGVHFVPLARGLPAPAYYVSAAALVGLGLAGLGVGEWAARLTLVSAGAAVILWSTAAFALQRARAPGTSEPPPPVS
jgi:hypothetical protein